MSAFPINPQPGAQMQTVPGGGGSQNLSPLSSGLMTNTNLSPVTATLPGAQSPAATTSLGAAPISTLGPTGVGATASVPTGVTSVAGGFNPSAGVTNPSATTQQGGDYTLMGDFQQTYGQGTGTALANTLANLGTSTSIAEQNMIGSTMQAAQRGYGSIQAGMGERGVSADSSTAALASGDYWGQVSQGIASETGTIGLNEEQQLISALQKEGGAHGSDVSGWTTFGNIMGDVGQAVATGATYAAMA